jgi:hypothetical protein
MTCLRNGSSAEPLLREKLYQTSREIIGHAFFQSEYRPEDDNAQIFNPFFRYYDREISWLTVGASAANDQTIGVILETHDDVATAVKALRDGIDSSRSGIRSSCVRNFNEEKKKKGSTDLSTSWRVCGPWSM